MKYKKPVLIIATAVALIAITALTGWVLDIKELCSVLAHYNSMKFNTSLAILASACALLVIACSLHPRIWIYKSLAGIPLLIGGLTLLQYALDRDFGIDQLLIRDTYYLPHLRLLPGRMTVLAAFNLFLFGGALLAILSRFPWLRMLAQASFHSITLMTFVAALSYFFEVPSFYKFYFLSAMALPTSVSLFGLSIAASCINPDLLVTGLFTGDGIGNRMARRFFPLTLVAIVVLTFFRIYLYQHDFVSTDLGILLLSVSFSLVSLLMICDAAGALNRVDRQRREAEEHLLYTNRNLDAQVRQRTSELQEIIVQLNESQKILSRSESLLSGIFDNTEVAIFVKDLQGKYLMANHAFAALQQKRIEDIIGKTVYDLTEPAIADQLWAKDQELFRTDQPTTYQMTFPTADGECVGLINKFTLKDANGTTFALCCLATDITAIKKTKANLRALIHSAAVAIIATDHYGLITEFNRGAELLLGYSAVEVKGKLTPHVFHLEEELQERAKELSLELGRTVKPFSVFVELPSHGQPESRRWTYRRKDGRLIPVQLAVSAIKDEAGNIQGYLGIATDVSELEASRQKLRVLSEKLQSQNKQLLHFAHITSHNLRTPVSNLNVLLTLYEMSETQEEREELFGHFSQVIEHLSSTLNELIDSLKVQRDQDKKKESLEFESVFNKTVEILSGQVLETGAQIVHDFSAAPVMVYPRSYLESILLNLISNAIRYRSPDRRLEIQVRSFLEDGNIVLTVSDNGVGMDVKHYGHKLFGLNNTFHPHAESKGVGLFMTRTQVEAMGGEISAEGAVDQGMTFRVVFKKGNA